MAVQKRCSMSKQCEKVLDVAKSINWTFGRGEVVEVRFSSKSSGVAVREVPVSQNARVREERRIRLENGRVHFLGRVKRLPS